MTLQKIQAPVVFYSSFAREIPSYLQGIMGAHLILVHSMDELKVIFAQNPDIKLFIFNIEKYEEPLFKAIAQIPEKLAEAKVLIIAGFSQRQVGRLDQSQSVIWLSAHQEVEARSLVTRHMQGQPFKLRRFERKPLRAPVMIKRSHFTDNNLASTTQIDLLADAEMIDFSKGGAQIRMTNHHLDRKDMVSLLYQNQNGQWMTIESQVRWVSDTQDGRKALGLQFIALSA